MNIFVMSNMYEISSIMNHCQVCGSAVLQVKNRRLLESTSSKHCRDGVVALGRSIAVDHISLERELNMSARNAF